jgi:mannose-6-phosphate isomerase-like protein (cupin superfamily)
MDSVANASPVPFEGIVADIAPDRSISIRPTVAGPPKRIEGYSVGAVASSVGPGPHAGEVHPDGDELLYVVSGAMELILDDGDEHGPGVETSVHLAAGDVYVVPRGVWHRREALEPSHLVHVTPGPSGGYRPRRPS